MAQKYKVYIGNRPVIFAQKGENAAEKGMQRIASSGKNDTNIIEDLFKRGAKGVCIECSDPEQAWNIFQHHYEIVLAAGGLVQNTEGKVLFIYRLGRWDLPKGKVEPDETLEIAAIREVEEECSIGELQLLKPLINTWHTYNQHNTPMLKCTAWYMMQYSGIKKPLPQTEEGITEAKWIDLDNAEEFEKIKSNTYPSVMDVIAAFFATKR